MEPADDPAVRRAFVALRDCTDPRCSLCRACCQTIWSMLGDWVDPADRPRPKARPIAATDPIRTYRSASKRKGHHS